MFDEYPRYYVSAFVWHQGDEESDGEYIHKTLFETTDLSDAKRTYDETEPTADMQHIELWTETEDGDIRMRYKDRLSDGTVLEEIEED